jgi:hypothetical protein
MRHLRLQDMDLNENAPKIYITRGKNHFRLTEISPECSCANTSEKAV